MLEAAAALTTFESTTNFYDADMKAMEQYRKGRNEVISLDPVFIEEMSNAGNDWIQKVALQQKEKGNVKMSEILDNYQTYHKRWKEQSDYLIKD